MKLYLKLAISLFAMSSAVNATPKIDLIVFSKNRPLQLYAFLESYEKYVTGTNRISVIYYADEPHEQAYEILHKWFPAVHFIWQSTQTPYTDFKRLVCDAFFATQAECILFAVDDIVVIDHIDLIQCAQLLKKYKSAGFYLRLGNDIDTCYTEDYHTGVPRLRRHETCVYSWAFSEGKGDWNYPYTIDMTLYNKKEIRLCIQHTFYDSPNTFEETLMDCMKQKTLRRRGLCFEKSKMVNLPLNLVQEDFVENRHATDCDVQFLLAKFQQGFKMDIAPLHQFPHKAPHAEYVPTFIPREDRE